MDKKISLKNIGRHNSILFKITSQCNDFCNFCLEYKFIKDRRPHLLLKEFKKNYLYFKDRFTVDYVILTGGEPTLHPDFFKMLDFLKDHGENFRFITNLLKFNEREFLSKLTPIFSGYKSKKQEKVSKIIASINDLPEKGDIAKKRFSGLVNALELKLPVMMIIMIYRDNLDDLPKLAKRLKVLFEKKGQDRNFHIEFRSIYIKGTLPGLLKKSLPRDFNKVRSNIEQSIEILDLSNTQVTLWNFPICYLNNYQRIKNLALKERQERRIIKVNKDAQFDNAEVRDWKEYLKANRPCQKCKLTQFCSGVDKLYLDRKIYPPLMPY